MTDSNQERIPRRAYVWLALIVVIAAALRLPDLTTAPLGGHGDVSWVGLNALDWVDRGVWPFYIREMYAPEFPVVLLNGLLLPFTGISFLSPRLITAGTGLIFVALLFPATWWLLVGYRRETRVRAGLFAALSGAVSIQAMYLSRLGMESPPFLAALTSVIWLTAWAIARGRWWQWLSAGAAAGFAQYIYLPARLLPLLLVAWFGFSTWVEVRWNNPNNNISHHRWRSWLLLAIGAVIVALPALVLFLTVPGSFSGRADAGTADTGGWIWAYDTSAQGGLFGLMLKKVTLELRAFGIEWSGPYTLMGQPMLRPIFFVGFVIALLFWLRSPRQRALVWPLIGIPVMFITDLISGTVVELHALHQMGVLPFVFILSGIGLALGWDLIVPRVARWFGAHTVRTLALGIVLIAIVPGVSSTIDYLQVIIPFAYADPQTGWQAEQIDVDLSQRINSAPNDAYLLPYSEYSRSNEAWLLSASFRDRRSAIDARGRLQLPSLPVNMIVIHMVASGRPRHDARLSMDDSRLWVLLYHGQTLLLPPLTPAQDASLQNTMATEPANLPAALIDRSRNTIAYLYTVPTAVLTMPEANPAPMISLKATFNNQIDLLGYMLNTPSGDMTPGQVLFITLYWHIRQQVTEDYNISAQLWTDDKIAVVSTTDFPFGGAYRTRIWRPDEIVATHHWLQLPNDLPTARYTLAVGMLHLLGEKLVPITGDNADLTTGFALAADLRRPPPLFDTVPVLGPPLTVPIQFGNTSGNIFAVSGVDLRLDRIDQPLSVAKPLTYPVLPGQSLVVDLIWKTLQRPARDYTVFLHLASAPNVAPIAQADLRMGVNANLSFPTGAWRPGEVYQSNLLVTVPATLAAGPYQLLIGVYYWQTGERLLLNDQPGTDQWLIGMLNVG